MKTSDYRVDADNSIGRGSEILRTSEILDLAADEIERRGWVGHERPDGIDPWGNGAGSKEPVCLEGGIMAAMGLVKVGQTNEEWASFQSCPAYLAMHDYLSLGDGELWGWNDSPFRTVSQVIEALRGCAAVERAKEESLEGSEVLA